MCDRRDRRDSLRLDPRSESRERFVGVHAWLGRSERTLDLGVFHRSSLRKASSARRSNVPTLDARTSSDAAISA